ncbi:MAG: phosphodiester glycosidase family protein [Clostridium sp.]
MNFFKNLKLTKEKIFNREDTNDMQNRKSKKEKKHRKIKWKTVLIFLVFEFFFCLITAPFILLYGPFENSKRTFVGAAMTSMSKQWLATTFLSQERIDEILNTTNESDKVAAEDEGEIEVTIPTKRDDSLELFTFENYKFKGYYLVVNDPKRIEVAHTNKLLKEGQTTSQMAKDTGAVAAVNGGAFQDTSSTSTWSGNGGTPAGIIVSNGETVYNDVPSSELISGVFAMTKEGKMLAGDYTIAQLKEQNVTQALTFGPVLIQGGRPTPMKGDGGWGIAPRTAVGQRADGAMVLLVIEGRTVSTPGASLKELQEILLNTCKCVTAINLDGGKSSTMYLNGKVVNKLGSNVGERSIPSSIIVR